MTATSRRFRFRNVSLVTAMLLLALAVSACERSEESFRTVRNAEATNPNAPLQETAGLIKRLEAAKEMDESQAHRPGVSAVGWEDDMTQAGKADKAIKELAHGLDVPQSELDEALWVPPASQSGAEKARLIQQVKRSIQQDQRQENAETLESNMGGYPYPINTMVRLQDHKEDAEGVLRDLEIGEDVHWDAIKRATQTPAPED